MGGEVQHSGDGVSGHQVGGRRSLLLPPGALFDPLFGPCPASLAPPHEAHECAAHPVVSSFTAF